MTNPTPITAKHLHDMLSDRRFYYNVDDLREQSSEDELLFRVRHCLYTSEYDIMCVSQSSGQDTAGAFIHVADNELTGRVYDLFHIHSHTSGIPVPSVDDLESLSAAVLTQFEEEEIFANIICGIVPYCADVPSGLLLFQMVEPDALSLHDIHNEIGRAHV